VRCGAVRCGAVRCGPGGAEVAAPAAVQAAPVCPQASLRAPVPHCPAHQPRARDLAAQRVTPHARLIADRRNVVGAGAGPWRGTGATGVEGWGGAEMRGAGAASLTHNAQLRPLAGTLQRGRGSGGGTQQGRRERAAAARAGSSSSGGGHGRHVRRSRRPRPLTRACAPASRYRRPCPGTCAPAGWC
jgi:hypothetical protein